MVITFKHDDGKFSLLVADLETWFEERQVIFEAGVNAALYDALHVCKHTDYPMPAWVLDGAIKVVRERTVRGASKGKGPKANDAKAFYKDHDHFRRWLAVKKLLRAGEPHDSEIFAKAVPLLDAVGAKCSEGTVKRSFGIVEKDMKTPSNSRKYYLPLREIRIALDIKPLLKGVTFAKPD
ncbi:hypothetical protein RJ527_09095 [Thalassospiraceae bacterium LMO-SO8]|nr:hypothetical protein [Alphaproteobacteria bacterium LMO-S08]WND77887.1 hypothetical protein RJ527_09095 [Thalassospiraceae bacterium LMO-SO8]